MWTAYPEKPPMALDPGRKRKMADEDKTQAEPDTTHAFWSPMLRSVPVLFLLVCFVLCAFWSWHWPLVHDASIMHYVVFLMDHGMAPYRDIIDINMPGTFMIQWLIVHICGGGPTAWRCFDIFTMLAATAAACWIALPYDWRAGAVAGFGLALFHLANGPVEVGQRDWLLMVLLLFGYAFLFHAIRTQQPWFMGLFAAATGTAASIKPLAIPFPILLMLIVWLLLRRRQGAGFGPYLRWAILGACIPILASLLFLWRWKAAGAFFTMVHGLLAFYAGVANVPQSTLMQMAFGRFLWTMIVCGLLVCVLVKSWQYYEVNLLGLGIVFGLILYLGQRKGFSYHKATLVAFLLLWLLIQFYIAVRQRGVARLFGAGSVLAFCLGAGLLWARAVPAASFDQAMLFALQQDLEGLGGPALSGRVQCLDMVSGCITDLLRMRLLQPTGFISDMFVFSRDRVPALDALKDRFLAEAHARPPRIVILVAAPETTGRVSYAQLENWPELRSFLAQDYTLYKETRLPNGSLDRHSYQLYLRK
jgi:hypothetical protein